MSKTTRDADLEIIDQARYKAKTKEGRVHREALLVKIYEMSKDPWLEKMRRLTHKCLVKMEECRQKGDILGQDQAYQELMFLKRKIQAYGQSEAFRRNIARKIVRARLPDGEAKLFYEKYE